MEKEAHARTREAHDRTRQELDELRRVVAGLSGPSATMGPDMGTDPVSPTLPSSPTLPPSPTVPRKESVLVESTDTDTPEPSVSLQGRTSPAHKLSDVESASRIAKQVRNDPHTRHPLMLRISLYVNPSQRCTNQESAQDDIHCMQRTRQRRWKGTREVSVLRFVNFTITAQVLCTFLYAVPSTAHHDIMLHYADHR